MKSLTNWKYSIDTEVDRIIHCAHQIAVGFYKINNFIVLPKYHGPNSANIVIFPNYKYHEITKFWSNVAKVDIQTYPHIIDKEFHSICKKHLFVVNLEDPRYEEIKERWNKAEVEILKTIFEMLPEKKGVLKKITIQPSKLGTSCSFSYKITNGEIIISLRDDQGIHAITEAIITSLTRDDVYKKLEGTWQESEIITDFLVTQTKLAKVLQKYEGKDKYIPTIKGTRVKDVGNLQKLSDEYYKKLNIPNFDKPFNLNGLTPEINKKPILNLTPKEKQVMYLLIKNSNNIISFDQISDIIFSSDDDFSLFAMAKFIQRLREKLEKNGVSGSFIQTIRSKGYLLKN